jgi:hypothetical protein
MPAIPELFAKYLNPLFIETGAYIGDGINAALIAGFQHVVSVELSRHFYATCCARFENEPRVSLVHGNSADVLPVILRVVHYPATFWLDAHWSGGDTANTAPLGAELAALSTHAVKTHTLLIDDVGIHNSAALEAVLRAINPAYTIAYENGRVPNDILVATCKL